MADSKSRTMTDWDTEIDTIRDALSDAREQGMTPVEIAEVMYNCAVHLKFCAQLDMEEVPTV